MHVTNEILSDITVFTKYAKYLPQEKRRENWFDLCTRNMEMHIKKYPRLAIEIRDVYENFVYTKKVLPSMRSLQFGGRPIEIAPNRIFNCAFLPVDSIYSFSEAMFLLLGGTGVGFSVQRHHVEQLPSVYKPKKRNRRFLVGDSIEGWADAIKVLLEAYFMHKSTPVFDFTDIRPKGADLVTSGGKAPGPQPLKDAIHNITKILDAKQPGSQLTTLEAHDIMCLLADAVLAGGIRRAALISLFSMDDEDLLSCKAGTWWEQHPHRARANNSAVVLRHKITRPEFMKLWERVEASGAGEPGVYFSNDKDWGTNPSLRKGTKVITSDGIFPIEQLQGKPFTVKNLEGKISPAECWLSGRNQKLWELTLKCGEKYYATKEHEWPVWDGTRYVKVTTPNIPSGSKLPFLREKKLFEGTLGDYEDGFLCGWILGDGWVTNRKNYSEYGMIVSDKDDESGISDKLISNLRSKVPSFIGNFHQRGASKEISINNKEVDKYLKQFGIVDKKYGLPDAVWSEGSEDFRKGLLDALFSADGSVEKGKKRVVLTSAKDKMIHEVAELLGFYGVKTVVPKGKTKLNGKEFARWDLRIQEGQSIRQFQSIITLTHKHKQERIEAYKYNKIAEKNYVEVVSVKETDLYEDVWDISVKDETHCFQLAKVVTGNCCEIGLRPYQMCNLSEINASNIESQEDLNSRCAAASFIGTLQAGYTDFHYLRDIWKKNVEKDALIGVSMTGIGSGVVLDYDLVEASQAVVIENIRVAELININPAARTTTVKPSGTASMVLGSSSGIHAWHNDYYIRRMRVAKNESIYKYLKKEVPALVVDEFFQPTTSAVIEVPQAAPEGALMRTESSETLLERVKMFNTDWVRPGHNDGQNTHNVSCTISVKDGEWGMVGDWMWSNRNDFNGIACLPYDGGSYVQAPFENITEEEFLERVQHLHAVDLDSVVEQEDETDLAGELACAGGLCEI